MRNISSTSLILRCHTETTVFFIVYLLTYIVRALPFHRLNIPSVFNERALHASTAYNNAAAILYVLKSVCPSATLGDFVETASHFCTAWLVTNHSNFHTPNIVKKFRRRPPKDTGTVLKIYNIQQISGHISKTIQLRYTHRYHGTLIGIIIVKTSFKRPCKGQAGI